jgi:eukaryotic-like serine/threonine-protein kinase
MTTRVDPLQRHVDSRVGTLLNNKWQLEELIGMGGMAAVYKAVHRNGKRAAVKILHPIFPKETNVRERFLREGYLANKVEHPGTVSVIDDDTTPEGEVFLVMELLDGVAVDELLGRFGGVMTHPHVLAIAEQVLDVLVAAHGKGVIHRDLKPGNLFLTRERRVKVLDFGLARLLEPTPGSSLTGAGMVLGTPGYMPPEQARAQWHLVDGRTDLFAVGAVMYRLLSGKPTHEAATQHERQVMAMNRQVDSLAAVAPDVPKSVVALVDKALAFEMSARWRDAATFQAAVRNAMVVHDVAGLGGAPVPSAVPPSELTQSTLDERIAGRQDPSIEIEMCMSEIVEPSIEMVPGSGPATVPERQRQSHRASEISVCLIDEIMSKCDIMIEDSMPETRKLKS